MKILVPIQLVPDLVEELEINEDGNGFDLDYLAWIINEFDDHAIEQAILIKESIGAQIIVAAPDWDTAEDALYNAAAKGADKLIKIESDYEDKGMNNHALARIFKPIIEEEQPDLVLTGVSNHNGIDGALGALLAEYLGMPYAGYISSVKVKGGKAFVHKDYPGGLKADLEIALPAVLGIASAESPPRYVPISKVRQAMKTSEIKALEGEIDLSGCLEVKSMYEPEIAGKAEMLEGNVDEIVKRLVEIIKDQGLI